TRSRCRTWRSSKGAPQSASSRRARRRCPCTRRATVSSATTSCARWPPTTATSRARPTRSAWSGATCTGRCQASRSCRRAVGGRRRCRPRMTKIIECIPNVSEGRRSDVVESIASAIRAVPGVRLLDYSSDGSHNRSVFTLAGDPGPLKAAVLALYDRALASIDLRAHSGEHPRLGAVDVVPFVPIDGVSMADCVALAKDVASDVAGRFGVPVYLYEEASANPARKNLEDIRRGEFEGLAAKMAGPDWRPHSRPAPPHPTAGP